MLTGEAVQFDGAVLRTHGQLTVTDSHPVPVLHAAMGPRMLQLAGTMTDGTLLAWAGAKNVRDTWPRPSAPSRRLQGVQHRASARRCRSASPTTSTPHTVSPPSCSPSTRTFRRHRTILDREGKATVADVALIGNEELVGEQLADLADAGVADFAAAVYGAPEERDRTISLLSTTRRPG